MNRTNAAVLIIGSEVLDGRIVDTNSNFLFKEFKKLGIRAKSTITVDDNLEEIKSALSQLLLENDLIITSGGLGPTTDDLTREALAEYFKVKLLRDETTLGKLKEIYRQRQRPFPPSNQKQALYPENSSIINNNFGTAPAILIEQGRKTIIALPGVSRELQGIFTEQLKDYLQKKYTSGLTAEYQFKFIGLPESAINDEIIKLQLPEEIRIIYQASFPDIKLIIRSDQQELLDKYRQLILNHFNPENIFTENNQSLSEIIHNLLTKRKLKIAAAESCSAGLFTSTLAENPGSSVYLLGGIVSYDNRIKSDFLDISAEMLSQHGAVSAECAGAMAQSVRDKFKADIGVSITGIAGPDGGSPDKPVGTVFLGISDQCATKTYQIFFPSSRERVRTYAVQWLLNLLRINYQKGV